MKIDHTKINAAIDDYLAQLRDPKNMPMRIANLHYTKFILERHGVIESARDMDLWDHCTVWAACIVASGRVREVSRTEREERAVRPNQSFQKGLNKLRKNPMLRQRLEQHIQAAKKNAAA